MNKFIAYGVPRSGTTALAWLINMHPRAMCGNERFYPGYLTADCLTREGFLDETKRSNNFAKNAVLAEQKQNPYAIGDKKPHYFMNLKAITRRIPELKQIVILRDLPSVFYSWNRRAEDIHDQSWHRGAVGFWSFYEYLVLADEIIRQAGDGNFLILSYDALFGGEETARNELFDFLGLYALPNSIRLEKLLTSSLELSKVERPISEPERNFIEWTKYDLLYEKLLQAAFFSLEEFRNYLKANLNHIENNQNVLFEYSDALITMSRNSSTPGYLINLLDECANYNSGLILYKMAMKVDNRDTLVGQIIRLVYGAHANEIAEDLITIAAVLQEAFSETPEIHLAVAKLKMLQRHDSGALECIQRALDLDPSNSVALQKYAALTRI